MTRFRLGLMCLTVAGICLLAGCEDDPAEGGAAGSAGAAGQAGDGGATSDAGPDGDAGQSPSDAASEANEDASKPDASALTRVIQVLTIDDFHGQLDPVVLTEPGELVWYGGLGYLSAYFKEARAKYPDTIILNSGDEVGTGPVVTSYATDIPDEPSVLALNLLGLTASCLGNHNFDRGTQHLKKLMGLAQYSYLGANVSDPFDELGDKLVTTYRMLEFGEADPKLKVAIIGIANPDTAAKVLVGQMEHVSISDPVAAANTQAAAARAAGATVVLGVAHIGIHGRDPADGKTPVGPLADLVAKLQGFDYVHGGGTSQEHLSQEGDTLVVQGPARGHAFYRTLLSVQDGKVTAFDAEEVPVIGKKHRPLEPNAGVADGSTLDCSSGTCPTGFSCITDGSTPVCEQVVMTADPAAESLLAAWKSALYPKFDEQIGKMESYWKRDGEFERSKEAPLGDLIADAMLDAYKAEGMQIALVTGGALRDPLPSTYVPKAAGLRRLGCTSATPCDLVLADVYNVIQSGNSVVRRNLTGATLWKMLEHSVSTLPAVNDGSLPTDYDSRFLQVAGLKFTWKTGAQPGSRVQSVYLVDGATETPILNDELTTYAVGVTDFMNGGSDGYTMLKEPMPTPGLGIVGDAVTKYIKKKGTLTGGNPPTFNRIIEVP